MVDYRSVFRPNLFQGQTILVTGSGSGIGRCTAHELRALGAKVALVGRTAEKLDVVKEEMGGGEDVFTHACDLRQDGAVKEMVGEVLRWSGRVDGLVNNAGGQFPARLRDLSTNGWNAVIANNMTATFLVSREVFVQWMEANGGAIVSVGADWPLGMPGMGHNGAARAGQHNFTLTASVEWAASGVRLNQVIPGFIASSGFDRYPEGAHEVLRNAAKRVPLKRHGTEAEISAAIAFLLSEAAAYITGAYIRVDGGMHNYNKASFFDVPEHKSSKPYNGFPLYRTPKMLEGPSD
ncbi:MAG: SDR family oxidoreductase [Rhodospirillales bacterium]